MGEYLNSTRLIMTTSGLALFVAGLACLFAPVESLSAIGMPNPDEITSQLLGALYLGFAGANWAARANMIGGVYARPLSAANVLHFFVGALVLLNGLSIENSTAGYWVLTGVYAAFAVCFALIQYGRVLNVEASRADS